MSYITISDRVYGHFIMDAAFCDNTRVFVFLLSQQKPLLIEEIALGVGISVDDARVAIKSLSDARLIKKARGKNIGKQLDFEIPGSVPLDKPGWIYERWGYDILK